MEIFKIPGMTKLAYLVTAKYSQMKPVEARIIKTIMFIITRIFKLVTPFAFLTLPYLAFSKSEWSFIDMLIATWSISEIIFYTYNVFRLKKLAIRETSPVSKEARDEVLENVIEALRNSDVKLKNWLICPPDRDIDIGDITEWIIWLIFDKKVEDLSSEEFQHASEVLEKFDKNFEELRTKHDSPVERLDTMRPGIDPIAIIIKPLLFYLGLNLIKSPAWIILYYQGFRLKNLCQDYLYWDFCPAKPSNQDPIIIMPGIGIGISSYLGKIINIQHNFPNRKIIFIEIPHISFISSAKIPSSEQILNLMDKLIRKENLPACSWLAHSYGSLYLSLLIKYRPEYISKSTIIDSPCFQMWNPAGFRAGFYSEGFSFTHDILKYFFGTDILLAHALTKKFTWHQYNVYPHQLTRPVNLFFSTEDILFDVKSIVHYLGPRLNPNCHLELMETCHGGYLLYPNYLQKIINNL